MNNEERPSIIRGVLIDELTRNDRMRSRYLTELDSLPKGSLLLRRIGNQEYYYLKYRENKKVKSEYLGKNGKINIELIKDKIAKRKHIEMIIKNLESERKVINRALR
ncbi:MAG: hypothetical protein ACYC5K_08425 [Saccharofermentanales bacterium]